MDIFNYVNVIYGVYLSTSYSILIYAFVGIVLLGPLFFIGQLNFDSSGEVMTATVALGAIFRSNGRNISGYI